MWQVTVINPFTPSLAECKCLSKESLMYAWYFWLHWWRARPDTFGEEFKPLLFIIFCWTFPFQYLLSKVQCSLSEFFLLFIWSLMYSLCSRRLEVICRKEGTRDRDTPTPILSCAHYFQAPATHRLLMYHWYVPYMLRKRMIEIFLCEIQPQQICQRQHKRNHVTLMQKWKWE